MNEDVWFIWADLDHDDFWEEIPALPHYRFFKKNKRVDHLDGAYKEVFWEKVEKHAKKTDDGEWEEEEKKVTSF